MPWHNRLGSNSNLWAKASDYPMWFTIWPEPECSDRESRVGGKGRRDKKRTICSTTTSKRIYLVTSAVLFTISGFWKRPRLLNHLERNIYKDIGHSYLSLWCYQSAIHLLYISTKKLKPSGHTYMNVRVFKMSVSVNMIQLQWHQNLTKVISGFSCLFHWII